MRLIRLLEDPVVDGIATDAFVLIQSATQGRITLPRFATAAGIRTESIGRRRRRRGEMLFDYGFEFTIKRIKAVINNTHPAIETIKQE
jgi:hypothetical protein